VIYLGLPDVGAMWKLDALHLHDFSTMTMTKTALPERI
jgi:hypothetical protein